LAEKPSQAKVNTDALQQTFGIIPNEEEKVLKAAINPKVASQP